MRHMTAVQIHSIRKSFAEIERHRSLAALVFYRRLFEIAPQLRPMFKNDIEEQAQKLTDMLGALIGMLERAATLYTELRAMGARHAAYGVKDEHYAIVGRALLDMIAEVLAEKFTPEMREAWADLYAMVADTMREGAGNEFPAARTPATPPQQTRAATR